jgi:hypothetical protein
MGVKKILEDSAEIILPSAQHPDPPGGNPAEALRKLMEFYESGETENDEENDVDLINQLYGMTHHGTKSDY